MSNEHILITGTAGMVGSHLLEYYSGKVKKEFLIGTYFNPTINLNDIVDLCLPIEIDVRHAEAVEKIIHEFKPTKVFHLASQSFPMLTVVLCFYQNLNNVFVSRFEGM